MDEQTFKKLLNEALEPVKERLQHHTESLINIENTNKIYGDMYKLNNDNMKKLERRLERVEENIELQPDPEDTLASLQ